MKKIASCEALPVKESGCSSVEQGLAAADCTARAIAHAQGVQPTLFRSETLNDDRLKLTAIETEALQEIARYLIERQSKPSWQILHDAERRRGFTVVPVGSVPWLSADDWYEHDCVSLDGDEVRLVAIYARRPGTGALSRLILRILDAGLRPAVVCPFPAMLAILQRWGWREFNHGSTFEDRETIYRPRSRRAPR